MRWTPIRILIAVGIAAGAVERLVVWRSHVGALDSDEAVWGLMARHAADGQFTAFMWGQAYGGTLESVISAPLLAVFPGEHRCPAGYAHRSHRTCRISRLARRTANDRRAGRSSRRRALLGVAVLLDLEVHARPRILRRRRGCGPARAFLVLRLSERLTKSDAAALGLVVGVGLWQSAQLLPIALVATVWLIWRKPESLRLAPLALASAFVGFLPWTISNLRHDWWSFSFPPAAGTFASRLRGSMNGALPMVFGLRVPFDMSWIGGIAIGGTAMVVLYVGFVVVAIRKRRTNVSLLVVIALAFPLMAATSTFTGSSDEPRYLYIVSPVLVLLVSVALTTWQRAGVALFVAIALTFFGLDRMNDSPYFGERADGMFVPADFRPLTAALDRLGVDHVFADYWVAYRLDFTTDERIIAAESPQERYARRGNRVIVLDNDHVRYPPYVRAVADSPRPGHVILTGSPDNTNVDEQLMRAAGYRREQARRVHDLVSAVARIPLATPAPLIAGDPSTAATESASPWAGMPCSAVQRCGLPGGGTVRAVCGICGLLRPVEAGPDDVAIVRAAGDAIRHRGPDHGATAPLGRCTLGYRRLSVIDLATGDQPVANEDGSVVAVFNGEIYNYRALRAELEGKGHDLRGTGDTPTLPHLFEQHGDAFVEHLDGMFALAIWDATRQRLILARDRFGKKPLLWTQLQDGTVAFASELKALLTFPGVRRQVELERLDAYLALGYVPGDHTALRGINRLPPGSTLTIENGSATVNRYWRLEAMPQQRSDEEWLEAVREGVFAAVRKRLVSDVPLGALLSGGIDSSIVVAAMAQQSSRPRSDVLGRLHRPALRRAHARPLGRRALRHGPRGTPRRAATRRRCCRASPLVRRAVR